MYTHSTIKSSITHNSLSTETYGALEGTWWGVKIEFLLTRDPNFAISGFRLKYLGIPNSLFDINVIPEHLKEHYRHYGVPEGTIYVKPTSI